MAGNGAVLELTDAAAGVDDGKEVHGRSPGIAGWGEEIQQTMRDRKRLEREGRNRREGGKGNGRMERGGLDR